MINNLSVLLPAVVISLNDSPHRFFLTGSRFFGGATFESDWDFMVEFSQSSIDFLEGLGFELDIESTYADQTVARVYQMVVVHDGSHVKIDVQLIKALEDKLAVQDILAARWPQGLPGNKESRKLMWDAALAVFNARQQG